MATDENGTDATTLPLVSRAVSVLRQYFPKGTDLSGHPGTELARVALELNERPRKILACLGHTRSPIR